MENIQQVWNVDGPNQYNKPFIRIFYEEKLLPKETIHRVLNQIGSKQGQDLVAEISKRVLRTESDLVAVSQFSNNQKFILYFGVDEGSALSLFRTSTYILDRLVNNPNTTLEHIIKEIESPIHSAQKPYVIGVTGTNGKTTVVNLVYRMLMNCVNPKINVGKVDSLNVEINSVPVGGITDEQYDSSRYLLSQNIDAAVLELTRKGIWFSGLPTTNLSTGVITNVTNDHVGSYGVTSLDDLLDIKATVARNSRNVVVLNYQDGRLRELGKKLKDCRVVYFSLDAKDESGLGANYIYVNNNETIIIKSDGKKTVFINTKEIPFSGNGKIGYNTENILAALSALYFDPHIELDLERSSLYLKQLQTNNLISGRFNQFEFNKRKIIFDYAHNPDGIRKIGESLMRIEKTNYSCLVSIAESRNLEFCQQMAEQLSKYFNPIYLKETDEECKSKGGITITDLERSIRSVSPQTSVVFISQESYQTYLNSIKVGETGVILGAGLGNVQEVQKLILQYISEVPS